MEASRGKGLPLPIVKALIVYLRQLHACLVVLLQVMLAVPTPRSRTQCYNRRCWSGRRQTQKYMMASSRTFRERTRMSKRTFRVLCRRMRDDGLETKGRQVSVEERLLHFMEIVSEAVAMRSVAFEFHRSTRTVHRSFMEVLDVLYRYAKVSLSMVGPWAQHHRVSSTEEFSAFSECIGAIDGTHIPVRVKDDGQARWRNRKGVNSTNVLAVVDFNGRFRHVLVGWEGSAHDAWVLGDAVRRGFRVPQGKYILGDAAYPLANGILTPYRTVQYHLQRWRLQRRNPATAQELFNYRHSSLRMVVEQAFGQLKQKFRILTCMRQYSVRVQCRLIYALFGLWNIIGESEGVEWDSEMSSGEDHPPQEPSDEDDDEGTGSGMDRVRVLLTSELWEAYDPETGRVRDD